MDVACNNTFCLISNFNRNYDGLKTWATMGITESIKPKNVEKKKKNVEKYLTSDFSRYGVGSKKAIFNIGSEVTVISKDKNSRWVYEVSLSRVLLYLNLVFIF